MGTVDIDGLDEFDGQTMQIDFQNENLVARLDGEVVASMADLITVVEEETGRAITTESLRYGYRVRVVGIPTPEIMRTEAALEVWGPGYFDYDIPYRELETRYPDYYRDHGVPEENVHLV